MITFIIIRKVSFQVGILKTFPAKISFCVHITKNGTNTFLAIASLLLAVDALDNALGIGVDT